MRTAKNFEDNAILLTVIAHIRQTETSYDKLSANGLDRYEARTEIQKKVDETLNKWKQRLIY